MKAGTHISIGEQAAALVQQGSTDQAYHFLERAMLAGDGMAAATLAQWRLSGQFIRRDLGLARELYGRAASLGVHAAAPFHIAMLASGAGGLPRKWREAIAMLRSVAETDTWAQRQVQLLSAMHLTSEGDPAQSPQFERLPGALRIDVLPGFLTSAECSYLVDRATPMLQPSMVVHPQTGAMVRDPIRTAKSAGFPIVLEDPVLHAINRRIAMATGTDYVQGEPLQVLRYDQGDEYQAHSDALPPGQNQRVKTVVVALTADYSGGETEFPRLPYHWRGQTGDALSFDNVDKSGAKEPLAWHAGTRVKQGTKFLLSKWIRKYPLDLSGPPGRPF